MQGGAGTSKARLDRNAYSHHTTTLSFEKLQRFKLGNALFNKLWVSSPSSTLASDGLGPFYNARACESCHAKDGRGQLPSGDERSISFMLQLSNDHHHGEDGSKSRGDPVYGVQLHTAAIPGIAAEGRIVIEHEAHLIEYADGTTVELSAPRYDIADLAYGRLDPATRLAPRIAPSVIGMGLLESIDEHAVLAWSDPDDEDGDGISGRGNFQTLADGSRRIGRFGHKAGKATVREQTAHAFGEDMGLSTTILPDPNGDCRTPPTECNTLANGVQAKLGTVEVPDDLLDLVTFYVSNLAVPARRDVDHPEVLHGKRLFAEAGCGHCHVPRHVTSEAAVQSDHRFQLIWPYTDLLLHDMGDALADGVAVGEASGREWRTAPLWGLGAARTVNPRTSFLHDGSAASPMEAVLWHGGEAAVARDKVLEFTGDERASLARFLDSL